MIITLKALSPIAHGAFSDGIGTGNIAEFRRVPVVKDSKIHNVPTISGNAIRGIMRRLLTRELISENNLEQELTNKEFDKFYAMLGNGGALSNGLDAAVDVNYIREIRKQLPLLSAFGAACYKYMINGMCNIGFFKLKCTELGTGNMHISDMITEIGETRHVDKNIINSEDAAIKPMPYVTEAVIEGAEFEGAISVAPMMTDIEKSCLVHGIKLMNHVGGKAARGYGKVELDVNDNDISDGLYLQNIKNIDIDFIKEFIRSVS